MTGIVLGFDATHANLPKVPTKGNPQLAGYITGSTAIVWTEQDWAAHPGAIRIDQSPVNTALDETADVLDFENGAATLADIAPWAKNALANYEAAKRPGQRTPLIYASLSSVTNVANELTKAGLNNGKIGLWIAHWGVGEANAALDVLSGSGPFPVHGFQFLNAGAYDVDIFSLEWVNSRSHAPAPAPTFHGIVVTDALETFKVSSANKVNWNV